jgi:hypothetical protein
MDSSGKTGNNIKLLCRMLLVSTVVAPWASARALDTLFDISIGPRIDDLNWSISGTASAATRISCRN